MVDQEEARLENSEVILHNLIGEFRRQKIKIKVVDDDSISYKGIQFDLMDSPTDTLNGIIYLESPSRQVIPIREENLAEGVESIMQYVASQTENPIGKREKLSKFDFKFDPNSFDRALEEEMASLNDNPEYKKYNEFMERWNAPSSSKSNVVLDADDIRQPIRDWYTSTYPDDGLGTNLSDITFHDLYTGISQGLDVYDRIGVGDSIVRERLFERLAELKSVPYNTIYDMWLNGARKGMRKKSKKLSKNMKKYVEGAVPLPDPIVLNVNGQRYELKSNPAYVPVSMDYRKAEIRMDNIIIVARVEVKEPYFAYNWSVVAYYDNGWGAKVENVAPYYGYDIPIEDGIATNFREVGEAIDHVIQDYRMQSISGYYPDYNASAKKSVPSFSQMVKSIRKGEHLAKDGEHDFKVGDILVSSWGYEQTNVQWYQVVGVTAKSVKIREIKGRVQETAFMSGESVPIPDAFIDNLWFGEQKTARINSFGRVNITSDGHITAKKWDGYPKHVSWYA